MCISMVNRLSVALNDPFLHMKASPCVFYNDELDHNSFYLFSDYHIQFYRHYVDKFIFERRRSSIDSHDLALLRISF